MKMFPSDRTFSTCLCVLTPALNCFQTGGSYGQRIQSYICIFCVETVLPSASKAAYKQVGFDETNVSPTRLAIINSLLTWRERENCVLILNSKKKNQQLFPTTPWFRFDSPLSPDLTPRSTPTSFPGMFLFVFIHSFAYWYARCLFQ